MKTWLIFCIFVGAALATEEDGDKFEGDLILTPDQLDAVMEQDSKKGNKFAAMKARHWKTNGKADVVKYYIESSLTSVDQAMKAISDAVADYHKYTCIRFQRSYSKPTGPHISFFLGRGCYSYVGRIDRSSGQQISLGRGCWYKGTAMHEMGHALGFYHEQSRPDRDQYVEILLNNVRAGYENNFNKYKTDRIDSLGSPYDYRSMMHYGDAYFKKSSGMITIRTKDPKMQSVIGQRGGFSDGDIEQFNKMYCSGVTPSAGPATQPPNTNAPKTQPPTFAPRTTTNPGCVDLKSSATCNSWKIICGTNDYVKRNCRATCNLCNAPKTNAPNTNAPKTQPPTFAPRTTTNPGCSDISDQATCNIYKNAGLCSTNSYVHRQCPKTCSRCY